MLQKCNLGRRQINDNKKRHSWLDVRETAHAGSPCPLTVSSKGTACPVAYRERRWKKEEKERRRRNHVKAKASARLRPR